MQVIIFGALTEKFVGQLLYNNTYTISNGSIKNVNPNYKNVHSEFEIILQDINTIKNSKLTSKFKNIAYDFVPFKQIQDILNKQPSIRMLTFYGVT